MKGHFKFLAILSTIIMSVCGITQVEKARVDAAETNNSTVSEYKIVNKYNYRLSRALDKSPDTMEAWVKLPHSSVGGSVVSNYMHSHNKFNDISFGVDALGRLTLAWNSKSFNYTVEGKYINDNQWHHIAYVREKSQGLFIFYVDGIEVGRTKSYQKDSLCDLPFNFGVGYECFTDKKVPFDGKIKQVTMYNRALSVEDIKADMETEVIRSSDRTDLIGNWVLGESWTERYIQDTSDNDNDAKIASWEKHVGIYEADDFDYSIIVVPDIQILTHFNVSKLNYQAKWMVDNKEKYNIAHVLYVGDLSDVGTMESLYQQAATSMSQLDNKVDYCFVPGNHDYDDNFSQARLTTYYNKHFPYSKHSQMRTFGGVYEENKMDNSYYLFSVEGIDYLILNLEYRPRLEVLRWAGRLCEQYSNRRVLVNSHNLVQPDGNFTPIHADLVHDHLLSKYPNIMMSFSGHIPSDDIVVREDIGVYGNTVKSILVDLQGSTSNGSACDAFLLLKFNETKKTIQYCYYSPEHNACYNIQNQFTLSFADPMNPTIEY